MKNKIFLLTIIAVVVICILITNSALFILNLSNKSLNTQTVAVHQVGSNILANGSIHSSQEATLHFQTEGKLIYLPFQKGDNVGVGQTIAQLDTYILQRQLTQALNNYRSTRDTFDQTQANSGNGVLHTDQTSVLNPYNMNSLGGDSQNNAINDAIKRIVDQNQANLDNSVINVELANYALQLSTLTAPFSGVLANEDVTVAGQNITPVTSFSLEDPTSLVFRANISSSDIDYVQDGATAIVRITGYNQPLTGTVVKIYPQKITLPTGEDAYQVDISGGNIQQIAKYGQTGSVLISSSAHESTVKVPTWTILAHNKIWVEENNKPVLKNITIGKTHGNMTEVLSGLNSQDKIITNGASIAAQKYSLL